MKLKDIKKIELKSKAMHQNFTILQTSRLRILTKASARYLSMTTTNNTYYHQKKKVSQHPQQYYGKNRKKSFKLFLYITNIPCLE